ncbi:MAG: hypothetical protein QM758_25170 [Armatimonas sp.]
MWSQILAIVWMFLAIAMVAGVALGIAWQRLEKKPTPASEEIGTLKTKLKAAYEEFDACAETRKELEARVGDLEKALVSNKSRAAELEVRLRVMEAEKAERIATSTSVDSEPEAAPVTNPIEELATPEIESEPVSMEEEPEAARSATPEGAAWASLARSMDNDDLEEIHGIGPQLALLLHELGVHTYKQVALWSDSDIDRVEEKLPQFKGRIRRENWVRSAQECHWRKYQEAVGGYAP